MISSVQIMNIGVTIKCFRCQQHDAVGRLSMTDGESGLTVNLCLCKECMELPRVMLYDEYIGGGK